MDVDREVESLLQHIQRLGKQQADGTWAVPYGILVRDDDTAQEFEALVGTLRAAKKRNLITFEGQMLLSPTHDAVEIRTVKRA